MTNLPLTLSLEKQLLSEAESGLEAAADSATRALSVWVLAQLAYGKLECGSALDGFHAEPAETLRGLAAYLAGDAHLAGELGAVYRFFEQVEQGASELVYETGRDAALRELGSRLLHLVKGDAAEPLRPAINAAMLPFLRRGTADGTSGERSI